MIFPGLTALDLLHPGVVLAGGQRVGLEDLDVVQLEEQSHEAQHHEDPESSDTSFHQGAAAVVVGAPGAAVVVGALVGAVVAEPTEGEQNDELGSVSQLLVFSRFRT